MPRLIPWFSFLVLLIPSVVLSNPTSRDSFQWNGTWITRFIGQETEVVVPDGATEIRPGAFADCRSVTICAPKGARAEKYAEDWIIPFKAPHVDAGDF